MSFCGTCYPSWSILLCWLVTKLLVLLVLGCFLCLLSTVRLGRSSLFLPLVWISLLGLWRGVVVSQLLLTLRVLRWSNLLTRILFGFPFAGTVLYWIFIKKFFGIITYIWNFANCGWRYGFIMFLLNWLNSWFAFPARERASLIFVRVGMISIFPPVLFTATIRYCDISDAAWKIRDAEAAVMVCNVLNSNSSVSTSWTWWAK